MSDLEPYHPPGNCVALLLNLGDAHHNKDFFVGVTGNMALPVGAITGPNAVPGLGGTVHVCTVQYNPTQRAVLVSAVLGPQELLAEATKLQQSIAPAYPHYVPEPNTGVKPDPDETAYS